MMKRFRKIYVEITNICNMHCNFCPETKRAKAFMQVQKFKYIVEQIKEFTDYIYLHVKGEPLIHNELKEILNICNQNNLHINISTNGVLLKNKLDELLDANIRQLNISLHSFEKEDINNLEKYILDVIEAANKLNVKGSIIRYKLWNGDKDSNKYIISCLEKEYGVNITQGENISQDIKLKENIYLSIKQPFKWPDIASNNEEVTGNCHGLKNQLAILVDGTVVPCCVDNDGNIPLGNIFKEPLDSILNSKKAQDIIKGFNENRCVEELCKKCEYRKTV